MVRSRSQRQLLCIGQHLVAAPAAAGQAPLGSLEQPQLRAMTVAELDPALSERGGRGEAADWTGALADDHAAVAHFRQFGYAVIMDALAPTALARAQSVFRKKEPEARALWQRRTDWAAEPTVGHFFFDLQREGVDVVEGVDDVGSCGYLLTEAPEDLDALMEPLANPRVMPLLLALCGPAVHIAESNARRVPREARPKEEGVGYTAWHRDIGSTKNLPIGVDGSDYNRVKCFIMLSDVAREGIYTRRAHRKDFPIAIDFSIQPKKSE